MRIPADFKTPCAIVTWIFLVFMLGVWTDAQQQADPDKLQQALAQQTQLLGQCNSSLGPLQQLQAAVMAKQLVAPEELKTKFEAANPGKTWDDAMKVIDKPAEAQK